MVTTIKANNFFLEKYFVNKDYPALYFFTLHNKALSDKINPYILLFRMSGRVLLCMLAYLLMKSIMIF